MPKPKSTVRDVLSELSDKPKSQSAEMHIAASQLQRALSKLYTDQKEPDPKTWEFDPESDDDQDRLSRWLEKRMAQGATAEEMAKQMGVDAFTVTKLIRDRLKQDNLVRLFAVVQNMAKAQVLARYNEIIPKLTQALNEATEPALIQKIAETLTRFADLKPPDPKLLIANDGNETQPEIRTTFKLLDGIIGSSKAGGDGEVEDYPALERPSAAEQVPA